MRNECENVYKCIFSPHRERAARGNSHPPTAKPGWAQTCEEVPKMEDFV